ncbi:hypothetical protein [Flavobacterium sp. GCM10023249]|uniref:hypothetical protein n=1 Tax=unclassified Flavobacterium TaxID=196869 RepID=UPI00361CA6DC
MQKVIALLFLIAFVSCKQEKPNPSESFEEKIVAMAIEQKNNRAIELKDIYDDLVTEIPEDSIEKAVMVEILKEKGFAIIHWGRGNFTHGPRVINYTLKKGNCECEVAKYYYSTTEEATYLRSEAISCQ